MKPLGLFRGFLFYLLWIWTPTVCMFFADKWVLRWHTNINHDLLLLILPAGAFSAGATAYLGLRLGRGEDRSFWRYVLGGMAAVSKVLVAELVAGLLFGIGIATYAAMYGMEGFGSGMETAVSVFVVGIICPLVLSLVAGMASCTAGYVVGMAAGTRLRNCSGQDETCATPKRGDNAIVVVGIAAFATLNIAGLYGAWYGMSGTLSMGGEKLALLTLLESAFCIVLIGNLWACIVAFWFLWLRGRARAPMWRGWIWLVPMLGLVAFGFWSLRCLV